MAYENQLALVKLGCLIAAQRAVTPSAFHIVRTVRTEINRLEFYIVVYATHIITSKKGATLPNRAHLNNRSESLHYAAAGFSFFARLRGMANAMTAAIAIVTPTIRNELPTNPVASITRPASHGPR